ncbi:hypothetical protein GUITHDRAFT_121151 [Guillardia theta CCMP2712]|uniref:Uncharacterized protein n=1 Tax=Guillardia theta (strain CCMP2712) TaxID=905079 RepID=L1I8W0_GUITC|nr:hypothetical protein GUITHDRAFT_121151 [Guillardia theta CCMP2712]EKX32673.1 hypothetical protein GUITHDRAFT_121151 [Guillardia theta CCMP2712]|eukprot:XP_005819653.1 hypothetical protein GUITHDRAFT_121151 [Guillardia theta CCMP2712]
MLYSSGSTEGTMKSVSSDETLCNDSEYLSDATTSEMMVSDRPDSAHPNETCRQAEEGSTNSAQEVVRPACSPDDKSEVRDTKGARRYGDADATQRQPVFFFGDDALQLLATPTESALHHGMHGTTSRNAMSCAMTFKKP